MRRALLLVAGAVLACTDTTGTTSPAVVDITPDTLLIRVGQTQQFSAVVLNSFGAQLSGVPVTFFSANSGVATTTPGGLLTAVAVGSTTITARAGNASGMAQVRVATLGAAKVQLTPDSFDVAAGSSTPSTATVLDASDDVIPGAPVTYTSSDTAVFTVSSSGVVTARTSGVALLRAVSGSARDSSPVVVYRNFPGTLQPRVTIASRPFGVGISSQGVMYVTRQDADSLTRFNLPSLTAAAAAGVGDDPGEVIFTANGLKAFTTDVLGHTVTAVTVGTNNASGTYVLGSSAFRVRLSKDELVLYVSTDAGNVQFLDAATGTGLGGSVATTGPTNGLALSADGTRLYASGTTGGIAEINPATGTRLRLMSIGGQLQDIALSPDGSELYVANELGSVKVVRVSTGLQVDSIPLAGGPFGLRVSPNGYFVVVSLAGGGKVVVIDRVLRRVVRQFSVGGTPRRIAFDVTGVTMAVANESDGVDVVR